MADFFRLKAVEYDLQRILRKRGLEERGAVQQYVDSKVLEYCEPLVPMDTGMLIQSGKDHTQIGSGEVKYRTPYARRWYYWDANFQGAPERGNYWFERMKQRDRLRILEGARKLAGAKEGEA